MLFRSAYGVKIRSRRIFDKGHPGLCLLGAYGVKIRSRRIFDKGHPGLCLLGACGVKIRSRRIFECVASKKQIIAAYHDR